MVSGIILFTTLMGFFIVIEVLFHYAAIVAYLDSAKINLDVKILVGLVPVIITSGMFILVQLLALIVVYRKVLKVRPIIALKRVGG